jgi:dipeptidyl aminopeptidase/acylaminoacyl peptidase
MTRTGPSSRSQFRWPRHLCSLLFVFLGCYCAPIGRGQNLDKPLLNIDEDITAFSFAPDGRIAYAVHRPFKTKQYDLEHDDIWIQDANGKRRRIFAGEKFTRGNTLFTYTVDSFRWSPNGRLLLAQLFTATLDETGKAQDSMMTLVLEDNGKQLRVAGDDVIKDSTNPSWLLDNATVVYLSETVKPKVLYSFRYVNVTAGPTGPVFEGRTFVDSARLPRSNSAIAVERDRSLAGPPRLQRLDLLSQDDRELATLDGYAGGLSVSPSGKRVAYYLDREILEVRDLSDPSQVARLRIGLGVFQWAPDETRILLKRSVEKKSGDLIWIDIPPLAAHSSLDKDPPQVVQPPPISILHGLIFRDFAIPPDGRTLALIAPGKRNLLLFPLPR